MWAWHCVLKYPSRSKASHRFRRYLEEADTLESLNFNIAHRIVSGLLSLDLEDQLDLHPHLIHEGDILGNTPLLRATRCGNQDASVLLLQRGSDVNTHNWVGLTPLHYAVWEQDPMLCRIFLAAGADVNAFYTVKSASYRDVKESYGEGYTPLKYIANGANVELIMTLLQAGADPNIYPQEDDCTPAIFNFIKTDNVEILDLLCQYGADVNLRSRLWGYSAVMYAAQCNAKECVISLIEKGARLDYIGTDGASIIHTAAANASVELMHILAEAKIRGLPMDSQHVQSYWTQFDSRDTKYIGQRASMEVECAAFLALLHSVQVLGEDGEDDDAE
jgi:ankyrin repeat protein